MSVEGVSLRLGDDRGRRSDDILYPHPAFLRPGLESEYVADVVRGDEDAVNVLFCVCGREAEPHAAAKGKKKRRNFQY